MWVARMNDTVETVDQPDFITEQVFAYRINQIEAMLDWLDVVEGQIRAGEHLQA
jgi:hypothetical protein